MDKKANELSDGELVFQTLKDFASSEKVRTVIPYFIAFGLPTLFVLTLFSLNVFNTFEKKSSTHGLPIEMIKSKEDVQECAVIASNLASGDRVQERLFDVCLKKGWNE